MMFLPKNTTALRIISIVVSTLIIGFFSITTFAFAQQNNPPPVQQNTPQNNPPPTTSGGSQSVTGSESLINPLSGITSVNDLLVAILNVLIIIATPIIVIFIILAGFKYVMARGNPSQIEEAHKALTYAIIGGVLIIGAVALSTIVSNLVTAFK